MLQRLNFRLVCLTVGLLACFSQLGCSNASPESNLTLVPVKGKVTVNGVPLADAQVTFFLEGTPPAGYYGSGAKTKADGSFELTTGGSSGAVAGMYKITVSKLAQVDGSPLPVASALGMDAMQLQMMGKVIETVPAIYSHQPTTQLSQQVPTTGTTICSLELRN